MPVSVVLQFIADHAEHLTKHGSLVLDLPPEIDRAVVSAKVKRLYVVHLRRRRCAIDWPCCRRHIRTVHCTTLP